MKTTCTVNQTRHTKNLVKVLLAVALVPLILFSFTALQVPRHALSRLQT